MLLGVGRTADDERSFERNSIGVDVEGAPVSDKILVADDVSAEDGLAQLRHVDRNTNHRDEAIPGAHPTVKLVVVPRLPVLRESLRLLCSHSSALDSARYLSDTTYLANDDNILYAVAAFVLIRVVAHRGIK